MNGEKILKSTQEQALASWIDRLNQIRLNELIDAFLNQDINLENALKELEKLKRIVSNPEKIQGSMRTKHGTVAEYIQVYISNARKLIEGLKTEYIKRHKLDEIDYFCNSTPIQAKCVQFKCGLDAIKKHLEKYPNFLNNGGIYQIPKDYYEKLQKLASLTSKEAGKLNSTDYGLWKKIQELKNECGIDFEKIEPMVADYSEIQLKKVDDTIEKEEEALKEKDQEIRDAAYEKSKPTFKEGVKATAVCAAFEGGISFCMEIRKKLKSGKKLHEFTEKDWKDIGLTTGIDTAKGGIRGAVVYTLSNFTATPANVASALVTAAFGIVSQANEFSKGNIDNEEFIINSETVCLDVSISAIASILGQVVIPIPVLGAIIGNVVGMFMYDIAKKCCLEKEQEYIKSNNIAMTELNKQLDEEYRQLVELITEKFKEFKSAVDLAFDVNINIAFDGSIKLAELVGVGSDKILRNQEDIYNYFTM